MYPKAPTYLLVTLICLTTGFNHGCAPPSSTTIYVSPPTVVTRERLVARRVQEQSWIQSRLGEEYMPNGEVQGMEDLRIFESFINKTTLAFNPLGGDLAQTQQQSTVAQIRRDNKAADMQQELALLKLEQQMLDVKQQIKNNIPPPQTAASNDVNSQAASQNVGLSKEDLNTAIASLKPQLDSIESKLASAKSLTDLAPVPTAKANKAQTAVHPIDILKDQLAYRKTVLTSLREVDLDDIHDLHGQTLYNLKFDVTIASQSDQKLQKGRFASFRIIKIEPAIGDKKETYSQWVKYFKKELEKQAITIQAQWATMSQDEKDRLSAELDRISLRDLIASNNNSVLQNERNDTKLLTLSNEIRALKASLKPIVNSRQQPSGLAPDSNAIILTSEQKKIICILVTNRYERLNVYVTTSMPTEYGSYYIPTIAAHNVVPEEFSNNNGYWSIHSLSPREQAQNISQVAATQRLKQFALSLSAVIPSSGISAGNESEYINNTQRALDTINRVPQVVSFAHNPAFPDENKQILNAKVRSSVAKPATKPSVSQSNHQDSEVSSPEFGWLFGPRFAIDKKGDVTWRHTMRSHSVEAELVLPAWWQSAILTIETSWISQKTGKIYFSDRRAMSVNLPGDLAALTAFIFKGSDIRKPHIDKGSSTKAVASSGKPQQLLIRGSHLWRNPEVYLGATKASFVHLLPDMQGLLATFDQVPMPADHVKGSPATATLTVVTSQGIASIEDITIIPASKDKVGQYLVLDGSKINFDGNKPTISFKLNKSSAPASYHQHRLVISWLKDGQYSECKIFNRNPVYFAKSTNLVFTKTEADPALPDEPTVLTTQAQMQLSPEGDWMDVSKAAPVAYLPNNYKGALTPNVVASTADISEFLSNVKVTLPSSEVLMLAYPTLIKATGEAKAKLIGFNDLEVPVTLTKMADSEHTFRITIDQADGLADALKKIKKDESFTLKFKQGESVIDFGLVLEVTAKASGNDNAEKPKDKPKADAKT